MHGGRLERSGSLPCCSSISYSAICISRVPALLGRGISHILRSSSSYTLPCARHQSWKSVYEEKKKKKKRHVCHAGSERLGNPRLITKIAIVMSQARSPPSSLLSPGPCPGVASSNASLLLHPPSSHPPLLPPPLHHAAVPVERLMHGYNVLHCAPPRLALLFTRDLHPTLISFSAVLSFFPLPAPSLPPLILSSSF